MKRGFLLVAFATLGPAGGGAQTLDEAISAFRAGTYETAIESLGEISRSGSDLSPNDRRRAYVAYLSALTEVGRYEDALEALTQVPPVLETELANSAGEI
ncbi:MAG: hypothetical protein VYA38_06545, partial [Gemmatimonadota bacterium]|nr:hypothetical protein [Gemmatimonadota bacterium]